MSSCPHFLLAFHGASGVIETTPVLCTLQTQKILTFASLPLATQAQQQSVVALFGRQLSSYASVPMSVHEPDTKIGYERIEQTLKTVRELRPAPLTLAEKIVYGHLDNAQDASDIVRGETYLKLRPGE